MTDPDETAEPATVPAAVFIEPTDDEEAGALAALAQQESDNYARAHQPSPINEE